MLIQLGFEPSAFHSADCAYPIELTGSGKYSWLLSVVCKRQLSLSLLLSVYYVTLSAFWATFFIEYIPITVTLLPGTTFSVKYLHVKQHRFKIYMVTIIARRVHSFTCSGCKDFISLLFWKSSKQATPIGQKRRNLAKFIFFSWFLLSTLELNQQLLNCFSGCCERCFIECRTIFYLSQYNCICRGISPLGTASGDSWSFSTWKSTHLHLSGIM